MRTWFTDLDRVLRGEATRPEAMRDGAPDVPAGRLAAVGILLGVAYGVCLGTFGVANHPVPEWRLVLNGMIKVPALFALTLAVTGPSLYVFNALAGSRLTAPGLARLLAAALAVTLAVLASFGPVVAFFAVTTTSYPFVLLLNVAVFALAGTLGMTFLFQTLRRLGPTATEPPAEGAAATTPGVRVQAVFGWWVAVFALVGTQMSWVLRPFVGEPGMEFTWLRSRTSSFFEAVVQSLYRLIAP